MLYGEVVLGAILVVGSGVGDFARCPDHRLPLRCCRRDMYGPGAVWGGGSVGSLKVLVGYQGQSESAGGSSGGS